MEQQDSHNPADRAETASGEDTISSKTAVPRHGPAAPAGCRHTRVLKRNCNRGPFLKAPPRIDRALPPGSGAQRTGGQWIIANRIAQVPGKSSSTPEKAALI